MLFYCFEAWLPVILQEQGIALTQSGWMLSLVQFAQLPIVLIVPILADKMKDQRILVWITFCMIIIGLVGIFLHREYLYRSVCRIIWNGCRCCICSIDDVFQFAF